MTMFRALAFASFLSAATIGCGSDDDGTPVQPPSHAGETATYEAGPFTVEPGEELVMCTYVRGENDEAVDVVEFATTQSPGGHHLIVYMIDHAIDLPPSPCPQGGQPGWSQILVTQISEDRQVFPEGVGFRVQPHQQYVLETHYINTTPAALEVETSFATTYGAPGAVTQRAATYFFGTMNIDVVANGPGESSAACSPPEPMTLHTMFGHQHRWGTGIDVKLGRAGGAEEDLYASDDWEDPPIARFDAGLSIDTGDTIRVACDWKNGETAALRFPHEMCFAIGYYWPAEAGIVCVSGGQRDECECRRPGSVDSGPGGGALVVEVQREEEIANAGGPIDSGAPVYCGVFLEEDWGGIVPKEGAQPRYFRSAVDETMATAGDALTMEFEDVTPGDYVVTCMMDTIGGGWIPGSGDVVSIDAQSFTVEAGKTANASVVLDFAMP